MKRAYIFSRIPIPPGVFIVEKEVRLWRAVLDQALQDFKRPEDKLAKGKAITIEDKEIKDEAKVWLRGGTDHFDHICERAMLDKEEVMKRIEYELGDLWVLYD